MIENTSTVKQRKVDIPTEPPKKDDDESAENTPLSEAPKEAEGLVSRFGSGLWNFSSVRFFLLIIITHFGGAISTIDFTNIFEY